MVDIKDSKQIMEALSILDSDCIIVDKVFASCQQRKCFPEVQIEIEGCNKTFDYIKFKAGFIVPGTLIITELESRPNFKRVRLTVRIPYEVLDANGNVIGQGFLDDIPKDIILYLPDARDEFEFTIVVETKSEVLGMPVVSGDIITFAVGSFIIIKVVGKVQLLIPAYGYCPEPCECEEYSTQDVCNMFDYEDFPEFFPPQLSEQICGNSD